MIRINKKEQQILDEFFKEETTWFPNHVINKFLACILIGISSIILLMPYDIWNYNEDLKTVFMTYLLYLTGISVYANSFWVYNEDNTQKLLSKLLRWMPISLIQLKFYRLRKIIRLCKRLTLVSLIVKIFIAIVRQKFLVFDLIIVVMIGFIIPVTLSASSLLLRGKL